MIVQTQMADMETIAVIQSVYIKDKPEYLELSLDSIFHQTYQDFKVLLGIDGPITEELRNVIDNVKDNRLNILDYKENRGLAAILNDLLAICKIEGYEYIARMDSDDISVSKRFADQLSYLKEHSNIDLVGGAINEIDDDGNNRGKITTYPCSPEECRTFFAKRNPVAHPTVMFRRRFFEKAGWQYPSDFVRNEDTRLWLEGFKAGCQIANLPKVVLNFRMTDAMFKQRRNGKSFAKSQLQLRKIIAKQLDYGPKAYIYAYAMYILMISPGWMLKLAYRLLR